MLDPFNAPPRVLAHAIEPVANFLSLSTLPLHIHEIVLAWTSYHVIYTAVSPMVSTWLFPDIYPRLKAQTAINWNIRVTSFIQSSFITILALFIIWSDTERNEMDWAGRIWGYTGAGGAVQGFAAGYFLWDLIVSTIHLEVLGWGSLAHAISALIVTCLGFRPFANYYGLNFILYEISTPFLNLHWFFDKLNMTGSRVQLYNGIILLTTFFCCRVLWGNYQSLNIYLDVWTALHSPGIHRNNEPVSNHLGGFADTSLPAWLVLTYLGSNTVLNILNVYWFWKMVQALMRRFEGSQIKGKTS